MTNEEAEQKRVDDEKIERNKEIDDVIEVVSTPAGRRWYRRLMSKAGAFRCPYAGTDTNASNFNMGMQFLGFFMLDELMTAKPEAFQQMNREHKSSVTIKEIVRKNTED